MEVMEPLQSIICKYILIYYKPIYNIFFIGWGLGLYLLNFIYSPNPSHTIFFILERSEMLKMQSLYLSPDKSGKVFQDARKHFQTAARSFCSSRAARDPQPPFPFSPHFRNHILKTLLNSLKIQHERFVWKGQCCHLQLYFWCLRRKSFFFCSTCLLICTSDPYFAIKIGSKF